MIIIDRDRGTIGLRSGTCKLGNRFSQSIMCIRVVKISRYIKIDYISIIYNLNMNFIIDNILSSDKSEFMNR